jgi:spermidine synthase
MPEALVDDHPDVRVDVAEIDPEVAEIGRRYFRLGDYDENITPVIGDARAFLLGRETRYDLIFGDAYRGRQNVPDHLVTREFFELVKRRLTDDGVFMMNLIGAVRGTSSQFFTAVASTLLEVYPELYVFAILPAYPELTQNLILVAPVRERGFSRDDLIEQAGDDEALLRMVRNLVPRRTYDLSNGTVLTDDFNPVQYIIARQLRDSD